MRPALAILLAALATATDGCGAAQSPAAEPLPSAVVLVYHRFGETQHPSTNTPIAQLEAHIRELVSGGYRVLRLADVVAAFRLGTPLPDRTVAITVDDAYRSAFREAWPRLRRAGLPFTVFASTDGIDAGQPDLMSWDQLRELARAGVGIGHHGAAHAHPLGLTESAWRRDLERARRRFRAELGRAPELFAYPYGEWSAALKRAARELGFRAAFGQHSGAASIGSDRFALPRFAVSGAYGAAERFRLVTSSLPLPVREVGPADPVRTDGRPSRCASPWRAAGTPSCFVEGQPARSERDGDHIRILVPVRDAPHNLRINCTLRERSGRWRWFGLVFFHRF